MDNYESNEDNSNTDNVDDVKEEDIPQYIDPNDETVYIFSKKLVNDFCYIDYLKNDSRVIQNVMNYTIEIFNKLCHRFSKFGIDSFDEDTFENHSDLFYDYLNIELSIQYNYNKILFCGLLEKLEEYALYRALDELSNPSRSDEIYTQVMNFITSYLIDISRNYELNKSFDTSYDDNNFDLTAEIGEFLNSIGEEDYHDSLEEDSDDEEEDEE